MVQFIKSAGNASDERPTRPAGEAVLYFGDVIVRPVRRGAM